MRTAQETEQHLSEKIRFALQKEAIFDKFISLGQVAQNTGSDTSIPEHLKKEWIKRIEGFQMCLSDGLIQQLA